MIRVYTAYNYSAVEHYDFNTHPCCKKLYKIFFNESIWTKLRSTEYQKLALYAYILILFKNSAYTNINIM